MRCYLGGCPDGLYYLDTELNTTCVKEQVCTENGLLPYEDMETSGSYNKCIDREACLSMMQFIQKDDESGVERCMTLKHCAEIRPVHYAYHATSTCSTIEPEENGGF